MRHELTADTLARLILWGLDQAMAGRARPLRLRAAPSPTAPLVALIDYVSGFPCLWVTPFAFYGEKTATLLQALDRCLQTGQLDEVECCLLHALEPGRSLVFDWLVDLGFAHSEDGQCPRRMSTLEARRSRHLFNMSHAKGDAHLPARYVDVSPGWRADAETAAPPSRCPGSP